MKSALQLIPILLLFFFITSCQEEDVISGLNFGRSAPLPSPTIPPNLDFDSDGDGVPDSEDQCPDEYAYNDKDGDGCEDEGYVTAYKSSFSRIGRRPKPCEIPQNCEEVLILGEIIIAPALGVVVESAQATVYNAVKEIVGSSGEEHGGTAELSEDGAFLEVGLSDSQYKEETVRVMIRINLVVEGEEVVEKGIFEWNPEDF